MVFKNTTLYYSPYDDDHWTADYVADTIWSDIQSQEKNDLKRAKEILSNQYGGGAPDYDDFKHIADENKRWKAYDDATNKYGEKCLKEFFNIAFKTKYGGFLDGGEIVCRYWQTENQLQIIKGGVKIDFYVENFHDIKVILLPMIKMNDAKIYPLYESKSSIRKQKLKKINKKI